MVSAVTLLPRSDGGPADDQDAESSSKEVKEEEENHQQHQHQQQEHCVKPWDAPPPPEWLERHRTELWCGGARALNNNTFDPRA